MTTAHLLLRRAAKNMALTVDRLVPRDRGVTVLAYHRVGQRTASPVDLDASLFAAQMDLVAERGGALGLADAVARLRRRESVPDDASVLTFDDGTEDFVDVVVPILVERGLPATVYLATWHVDTGEHFPAAGRPVSWSAMRDALSTGLVTVGSHTHTHRLLDRCSTEDLDRELLVCDARIEHELGVRSRHFAYPKAVAGSPAADRAVRVRYDSAAVAGTRANPVDGTDVWRLRRSPIQVADAWSGFVRKLDGGMRTEDDVRRAVNRVRYRGRRS